MTSHRHEAQLAVARAARLAAEIADALRLAHDHRLGSLVDQIQRVRTLETALEVAELHRERGEKEKVDAT